MAQEFIYHQKTTRVVDRILNRDYKHYKHKTELHIWLFIWTVRTIGSNAKNRSRLTILTLKAQQFSIADSVLLIRSSSLLINKMVRLCDSCCDRFWIAFAEQSVECSLMYCYLCFRWNTQIDRTFDTNSVQTWMWTVLGPDWRFWSHTSVQMFYRSVSAIFWVDERQVVTKQRVCNNSWAFRFSYFHNHYFNFLVMLFPMLLKKITVLYYVLLFHNVLRWTWISFKKKLLVWFTFDKNIDSTLI